MAKKKSSGTSASRATSHLNHRDLEHAVATAHWPAAEMQARKILALRTRDPYALKVLGASLLQQGREIEAIPVLQRALETAPKDSEILNNAGIAYLFAAQWEASIEYFKQALAQQPRDYVIWKNLGRAYRRLHRLREAITALAKAIELHPDSYTEALLLLAETLSAGGQQEQAFNILKALHESGLATNSILSDLVFTGLKLSEWESLDDWVSVFYASNDFEGAQTSEPLRSLSFPGMNWSLHFRIASGHARIAAPRHSILSPPTASFVAKPAGTKLRVGFFSGDFRTHAVGFLMPQVIELHDRKRFEIIGYSVGDDDESDIRKRIVAAFDEFVDLGKLASRDAFQKLRADNLDILINLQGWTNDFASEFFAERIAPIQMSWVGYPGTMGHPVFADYLIADPIVTPLDKAEYFSETLALLNCCYLPMDSSGAPPIPASRKEAGLPEEKFVFCSLNNRYKINPPLFDLWCKILQRCPDSILWLNTGKPDANQRLISEFEKRGLPSARLYFAPWVSGQEEHRRRLGAADLALDTMPYNSHSSGLDTLWAGVPMISLLGNTFANRVGASLLHHADLKELTVNSTDEYCDLAVALYKDRARLQTLRNRLENGRKSASLWNTAGLAQSLQRVYQTAWENGIKGIKAPIVLEKTDTD